MHAGWDGVGPTLAARRVELVSVALFLSILIFAVRASAVSAAAVSLAGGGAPQAFEQKNYGCYDKNDDDNFLHKSLTQKSTGCLVRDVCCDVS